jgi:hypothetical protein
MVFAPGKTHWTQARQQAGGIEGSRREAVHSNGWAAVCYEVVWSEAAWTESPTG